MPVMQYHQQGIPLEKAAAATTSAASREEDGSDEEHSEESRHTAQRKTHDRKAA